VRSTGANALPRSIRKVFGVVRQHDDVHLLPCAAVVVGGVLIELKGLMILRKREREYC
jgi:hypothetical protein